MNIASSASSNARYFLKGYDMNQELTTIDLADKKSLLVTKSIICQADDLAQEHETFNADYIVGGRLALYDLLAKILALYKTLSVSPDKKNLIGKMKHKMLHTYRIKVQSNSTDIGVLVRYITRSDRKTAHVYARAIELALIQEISVENFGDFIKKSGGLEHIRSIGVDQGIKSQTELLQKSSWDLAMKYCRAREELPFSQFDLKKDLNFNKNSQLLYEYYACVSRGGKKFVVSKIPADDAFENRAIKLLGDYFSCDLDRAKELVLALEEKSRLAYQNRLSKEMPNVVKNFESLHKNREN